jgi:alcohol dehydrogenase
MKAVYFEKHGTIDNLIFGDWPDPTPGPAQCLVRVKAVSLNGFDPMVLRGIPGLKTPLPMIPGADFAGDVISIGANVPPGRFKPGDRVQVIPYWPPMGMMGETLRGGCCELVAVDHVQLLPIPDAVSYVDAATLPTAYGTALRMVNVRGEIETNEVVLVLGATGGVGTCAVQLCKLRGAIVVACASSAWKSERLEQLGADMVIDTSTQNFVEVLHGKFGKPRIWGESGGVDVVINYIGGDTWVNSLKVLKRSGRMLTCGATAGYAPPEDIRYIWSFEHKIIGSNAWLPEDQVELLRLVENGSLKPVVDRVIPLARFTEGLQAQMDRQVFGKVVLEP